MNRFDAIQLLKPGCSVVLDLHNGDADAATKDMKARLADHKALPYVDEGMRAVVEWRAKNRGT